MHFHKTKSLIKLYVIIHRKVKCCHFSDITSVNSIRWFQMNSNDLTMSNILSKHLSMDILKMIIMRHRNVINDQQSVFPSTHIWCYCWPCLPLKINDISMQCCLHFPLRLNTFLIVHFIYIVIAMVRYFFWFVGIFIGSIHLFASYPSEWPIAEKRDKIELHANCLNYEMLLMHWFENEWINWIEKKNL